MKGKKHLRVCMFVDPMGSILSEPEDEYREIEAIIKTTGVKASFETGVQPHDLSNHPCDIYVFDFGGMMPGAGMLVDSQYHSLIKAIEDRPNTLFIIWSTFSGRMYQEYLENEFPEHKDFHNVVIAAGGSCDDVTPTFLLEIANAANPGEGGKG